MRNSIQTTPAQAQHRRAPALAARGVLPGVAFFGAACALLLVDIFRGFWDHDSGFYFMQSLMIAEGLRPFIDFKTLYPPLFNAINAIPIALGIDRWLLVWTVPFAWALVISALTGWYWRREATSTPPALAWILAGLFPLFCIDFGGNHNTLELGIVFFGLLALVAYGRDRGPEPGQKEHGTGQGRSHAEKGARFVLVGALVGAAFLVKQPGALLLLPFITQCRSTAHGLRLIGGFLLPVVLCLIWLDFDFAAIDASLQAVRDYVSRDPPKSLASRLWRWLTVLPRDLQRTPFGVAFLVLVAVLGLRAVWIEIGMRRWRRALWLAAWLAVGGAFFSARAINDYPHYTLNVWPACIALLAAASQRLRPTEVRRLAAGALIGALVCTLLLLPRLRTWDGQPYFLRWRSDGMAGTFLRPVARELRELVPGGASLTHLGMEENVLLFLADRIPFNRDWAGHEIRSAIAGDAILFTDYGQGSAATQRAQILAAGYLLVKEWKSSWGTIVLYSRSP